MLRPVDYLSQPSLTCTPILHLMPLTSSPARPPSLTPSRTSPLALHLPASPVIYSDTRVSHLHRRDRESPFIWGLREFTINKNRATIIQATIKWDNIGLRCLATLDDRVAFMIVVCPRVLVIVLWLARSLALSVSLEFSVFSWVWFGFSHFLWCSSWFLSRVFRFSRSCSVLCSWIHRERLFVCVRSPWWSSNTLTSLTEDEKCSATFKSHL